MSLPELIPSNLPVFFRHTARSAFANSAVPSGSGLLFAESDGNGGSKFVVKNPDGSFSEVGGGGGGGGSGNFYKCASVGTGTWTGYLASVDPVTGVWSFASTATTGLTYDRITPVVGNVYDENCTFEVRGYKTPIPDDNLLFYLPLEAREPYDSAGSRAMTYYVENDLVFETYQGIPSMYSSAWNHYVKASESGLPTGTDYALSFSCWVNFSSSMDATAEAALIGYGRDSSYGSVGLEVKQTRIGCFGYYATCDLSAAGWHHVAAVRTSANAATLYVDGAEVGTGTAKTIYEGSGLALGRYSNQVSESGGGWIYGHIAAARIYGRALSATEIAALAAEFTPVVS